MKFYRIKVGYGKGHQSNSDFFLEFSDDYKKAEIDEMIEEELDDRFSHSCQFKATWRKQKPPKNYFEKRITVAKQSIINSRETVKELTKFIKENY